MNESLQTSDFKLQAVMTVFLLLRILKQIPVTSFPLLWSYKTLERLKQSGTMFITKLTQEWGFPEGLNLSLLYCFTT